MNEASLCCESVESAKSASVFFAVKLPRCGGTTLGSGSMCSMPAVSVRSLGDVRDSPSVLRFSPVFRRMPVRFVRECRLVGTLALFASFV